MRVFALLTVILLGAGCTTSEGGLRFGGEALALEPYFKEYRELLTGEHHKDFPIPVEGQARVTLVSVALETRDQGLSLPGTVPASLHVTILAPDGTVLQEASLDTQHRNATLALSDLAPGPYLARVDGFGASQDIDGQSYGAEYVLTTEILYE